MFRPYKEMLRPTPGIHNPLTRGATAPGRAPIDRAGYAARVPPVAVLTPFAFPSVRGNAITAERVVAGLRERGVRVSAWDLSTTTEADVAAAVEAWRPVLVHAFHAYRSGRWRCVWPGGSKSRWLSP